MLSVFSSFIHRICDCFDRLPMLCPTRSFSDDDNDTYSMANVSSSKTEPASDAVVHHRNKPSVQFVVPVKRKTADSRNEHSFRMSVTRPVVMQTLSCMQRLSDKCSHTSSNIKLPDQTIHADDKSVTGELLQSIPDGQNLVAKSCEPKLPITSQSGVEENVDTSSDCVVKDSLEKSLTVSAGDASEQQVSEKQACTDVDITCILQSSNVQYLSETAVDTAEQHNELSFTNDSVRTQRLNSKDRQLKRIENKSKLRSLKASPGILLMSRSSCNSSRLSLKDAVRGTRPCSYSLSEVTFQSTNKVIA